MYSSKGGKYQGDDLSSFVDITGGGGAISLEKERKLNDILASKNSNSKYLVGYGMTEISAAVSMNFNERNREQSIGLPLPFTNIKIVEYYKNKEETDKAIEVVNGERWIHTGDLAKIDRDGYVYITGRLKRIYITKDEENIAYKIFPQRMEEVIEECNF